MPGSGDRKQSIGSNGPRRKTIQSNTPNSNQSHELGSKPQSVEGHVPINNFNSQEVINHFDRTWKAAFEIASDPSKSEMYKGSETMAWGNKVAAKGAMSSGADFLAELKRKQSSTTS